MSNGDEYNGWTNRETWAFVLHFNNDQGLQEAALEIATDMADDYPHRVGEALIDYAETLFDEWHDVEGIRMMQSDIGSLWRIDAAEVGAAFQADAAEVA